MLTVSHGGVGVRVRVRLCRQTSCGTSRESVEWIAAIDEERGYVNNGHRNCSCEGEVVKDAA